MIDDAPAAPVLPVRFEGCPNGCGPLSTVTAVQGALFRHGGYGGRGARDVAHLRRVPVVEHLNARHDQPEDVVSP